SRHRALKKARYLSPKVTATGPVLVSNNPCQESLSAWLLCRMLFDTQPSAGLPSPHLQRSSLSLMRLGVPAVTDQLWKSFDNCSTATGTLIQVKCGRYNRPMHG